MISIGITGIIGSGKSMLSQVFRSMDIPVYDADSNAKILMNNNVQIKEALIGNFGEDTYTNGAINKEYLRKIVFGNEENRRLVNSIVHPAVKKDIIARQPDFIESAILYEAGLDELCDKVIVVDALEEVRIARTIARDYGNEVTEDNINKVRARIRAQHIPQGDLLIHNDGKTSIAELVDKIMCYMCKN